MFPFCKFTVTNLEHRNRPEYGVRGVTLTEEELRAVRENYDFMPLHIFKNKPPGTREKVRVSDKEIKNIEFLFQRKFAKRKLKSTAEDEQRRQQCQERFEKMIKEKGEARKKLALGQ